MATPVLQLDQLEKDYGDGLGLTPTTLEVNAGELVLAVGPNGAGKSTLLGLCAGLLEPSSGTVAVVGAEVGSTAARAATSVIPDHPALYDDLSVWEHAEYVARLHGLDDWETRGADLLDRLGLADRWDGLPSRFSRGLRQKTSLLLGFLRPAELLLIDEPFVGLDAPGQRTLVELIAEAVGAGATAVVSTHQLDLADRASRCLGLRDGTVVHDGGAGREVVLRLTAV
ncbi:MAG: ABC transporter ATP-binding protein [Acidobacteria bacterium]|nr:ABC transporter ATP-binding protein [Acidobacteriota bacterium]